MEDLFTLPETFWWSVLSIVGLVSIVDFDQTRALCGHIFLLVLEFQTIPSSADVVQLVLVQVCQGLGLHVIDQICNLLL